MSECSHHGHSGNPGQYRENRHLRVFAHQFEKACQRHNGLHPVGSFQVVRDEKRGGARYTVAHPAGSLVRLGCGDSRKRSSGVSPGTRRCSGRIASPNLTAADICPPKTLKNTGLRAQSVGGSTAQYRSRKSSQRGISIQLGAVTWDNVEGRRCTVSHDRITKHKAHPQRSR